ELGLSHSYSLLPMDSHDEIIPAALQTARQRISILLIIFNQQNLRHSSSFYSLSLFRGEVTRRCHVCSLPPDGALHGAVLQGCKRLSAGSVPRSHANAGVLLVSALSRL